MQAAVPHAGAASFRLQEIQAAPLVPAAHTALLWERRPALPVTLRQEHTLWAVGGTAQRRPRHVAQVSFRLVDSLPALRAHAMQGAMLWAVEEAALACAKPAAADG